MTNRDVITFKFASTYYIAISIHMFEI